MTESDGRDRKTKRVNWALRKKSECDMLFYMIACLQGRCSCGARGLNENLRRRRMRPIPMTSSNEV